MALHRDEVAPSGVHQIDFYSTTDPDSDPDNNVAAGKYWLKTDNLTTPTWFEYYRRNNADSAWVLMWAWSDKPDDWATGDTLYVDANGRLKKLAAGTNGHVLTLAAGLPSWAAPSAGALDDLTDVDAAAPNDGDVLTYVNASGNWEAQPAGSGGAWTQVVNESGTSFAAWTGISGTWSSDGTVIKQTDTSATYRSAYYATKLAQGAGVVHEAEVKMVSGGGATRVVGIAAVAPSAANGAIAVDLRVEAATKKINFERFNETTIVSLTQDWGAEDTWHKVRIVCAGSAMSAYLNGTLIDTSKGSLAGSGGGSYVLLTSYACEAHYRNIKTWVATGDLPA